MYLNEIFVTVVEYLFMYDGIIICALTPHLKPVLSLLQKNYLSKRRSYQDKICVDISLCSYAPFWVFFFNFTVVKRELFCAFEQPWGFIAYFE